METLPDKKRKNVVKKVKKEYTVNRVYEEYVDLSEVFSILQTEGGSGGSMAKGFSKLLKSPKSIGMLYTLRVKLPSLTPK